MPPPGKYRIHVQGAHGERELLATPGETLRSVLLAHDVSPYRGAFRQMNCKGLGVCGSCRVLVRENGSLWSRRSCQIRCFQDLNIELE